jgi:hypothetical protein
MVNVRSMAYFRPHGFPLVGLSTHVIDVSLATRSRQSSWMILRGKILNVERRVQANVEWRDLGKIYPDSRLSENLSSFGWGEFHHGKVGKIKGCRRGFASI